MAKLTQEKVNYYKDFVAEQAYGLYDGGWITEQQYDCLIANLDEATNEYIATSDEFEEENGELSLTEDLSFIYKAIDKTVRDCK